MQSLIFGGICGALGGFAFAIGTQSVQPDTYSSPVTFFALTALILGGMARVVGPVYFAESIPQRSIETSTDDVSWATRYVGPGLSDVALVNGRLVALSLYGSLLESQGSVWPLLTGCDQSPEPARRL